MTADDERLLTFKEYLQKEIPLYIRQWSLTKPVTSLTNLVTPLLKEREELETLKNMQEKIKKLEKKIGRPISSIEKWLLSPKQFIKIMVYDQWGKPIPKKIYKEQVKDEVALIVTFVFDEVISTMLYPEGGLPANLFPKDTKI